jgi:imidazolonepropionase-like amidohydrolase
MQTLQKTDPWLKPAEILETVTVNAARAIKREHELGKIAPDALADLIAVPFDGNTDDVFEAIVNNSKPVDWMMVNGEMTKTE